MKGADVAAHDRKPDAKRAYLERVDQALGSFLGRRDQPLSVLVTADHGTSSRTGVHLYEPAPVLLASWPLDDDEPTPFTEDSALGGSLGSVSASTLLDLLETA